MINSEPFALPYLTLVFLSKEGRKEGKENGLETRGSLF